MNYLLYNEKSDAGLGKENAEKAKEDLLSKGFAVDGFESMIGLDAPAFLGKLKKDDKVVFFGGDGTMNHVVNNIGDTPIPCDIYLYPAGTGNDFQRDLPEDCCDKATGLYHLNEFFKDLPLIEVQGKKYRFLNGVGYGIDGECCVEAERQKAAGKKKINYGSISIGLLLSGKYKAPDATIVIDGGKPIHFHKCYLAPTMNGRFYGGGMLIAPEQKRGSGSLSVVCIHGLNRFTAVLILAKLFKGTHTKKKKKVYIATGKTIEVTFSHPTGLQIDGEVLEGVTSYKVTLRS